MGRPLRALILEDSPLDFELLLRALRGEGFDVTPRRVENVRELREAIANERWDVVLSDYSMPELSVPISLRVLQEQQVDVPFIIVSGSVGEESAVDAMKAGAHDFFLKDRLARLGSAIDRELREAETRRQRRAADARLKESEQQLRQALQARDEFLRIASHELRTPLTPLALELQTALDLAHRLPAAQPAPELEKLESKLAKAVRNVERLKTLIENLLDVTRIASGELTLSRERVDLCETVTRLTDRLRGPRHPTADIALRCEGPVVGDWDPIAIESAVNNLLANAIKYGQGKPIEVTVALAGDRARLTVADHGIGISPEEQSRIFERFERAVPVEHYGGFGLGLWVARKLVEAHGGSIRVTSAEGTGSTFDIDLPLAATDK